MSGVGVVTLLLKPTDENIEAAATALKNGEIVAIPTETVYGLAADALNPQAVAKIFKAKERPQDNPLIVHISSLEMLNPLVNEVDEAAKSLMKAFWPGPLTIVLEKSELVPSIITAGLSTVAVRFPKNEIAQRLITASGCPLAAPSANSSGKPSPTRAEHVLEDLKGKLPFIVDGGECEVGLESTVVTTKGGKITLLRPGAVTLEMLSEHGEVTVAKGVLSELEQNEAALSPGMKHRHYSPKTKVIMVESELEPFYSLLKSKSGESIGALLFEGEEKGVEIPFVCYGKIGDGEVQGHELFSALRRLDSLGVDRVYARAPEKSGRGLAVYNRLLRACGFDVIRLDKKGE